MLTNDDNFVYFKAQHKFGKQLNASYLQSKKLYRIPMNIYALRELYKVLPEYREQIKELGLRESDKLKHLFDIKHEVYDDRLREYQNEDIEFLDKLSGRGVFNEQRTGKTPTTLISLRESQASKVLIICPSSLAQNWKKECAEWINKEVVVIRGTAKKRSKLIEEFNSTGGVAITSYGTLREDVDKYVTPIESVIVDEAHILRNRQTKQTKSILKVAKGSKRRYALTGTPSVNHASDVFGILHFLEPTKYPSYWQFVERYFNLYPSAYTEYEVAGMKDERINEWLNILSTTATQRKRKDIMKWLPEIQVQKIPLEMEATQRKAYNEMQETFTTGDVSAMNQLAQLVRLRQISLAPELLGLKGSSPKIEFVLDYIENNPDTPIVIFSQFTSFLKLISKYLKCPHEMLIGETKDKDGAVRAFQSGRVSLLLANVKVGGVGHTMDRGEVLIFTDRSFSPMENAQAGDRIVPTTEDKAKDSKLIIDLIMENSVDERILELLDKKENIISYVNDFGLKKLLRGGD